MAALHTGPRSVHTYVDANSEYELSVYNEYGRYVVYQTEYEDGMACGVSAVIDFSSLGEAKRFIALTPEERTRYLQGA